MSASRATSSIRAFVALDLDTMSARRIARLAEHLRMASGAPSATWTPATDMHVTLKFMGQLAPDRVAPLCEALAALVDKQNAPPPCSLRLEAFPTTTEADVVIVELDDRGGELGRLAASTNELAHKLGIARETRAFRPHVTLARLKRTYDARRWLRPELAANVGDCRGAHVVLYQSHLSPEGSRYEALGRFAFPSQDPVTRP